MIAEKPPPRRVHNYPVPVSGVTDSGSHLAHDGSPSEAQVLDQVDLAVIATNADGVVTTWNSRAETLYGWPREEAIGRHINDLTVPAESRRTAEEILAVLGQGRPWQGSFRLRRKDGSVFTAFVKDSPIVEEGRLIGVVGVSIEIADPELAAAVRTVVQVRPNSGRRTRTLSPREREVLSLLARGLTGEQIAERLVLSPETIRTHIRNAREKLGASTRVEAVTMALLAHEIEV
jgi:PAS domain S-box-containing protein